MIQDAKFFIRMITTCYDYNDIVHLDGNEFTTAVFCDYSNRIFHKRLVYLNRKQILENLYD
jgi:hypothetical protein